MKREDGFTLIETLLAMVILVIGLTILVEGYQLVISALEKERDYTFLNSWSEDKISEIITGVELSRHGQVRHQQQDYYWQIDEEYLAEDLRKIVLEIEWQGKSSPCYYQLDRIVYSGGI